ncbi:MAG: Putative nucleic acid-binding protein [uncultured Sulfurovum sp.]|uniref:Nucleic acid-binding protein n=1 Tax=uncultured Sulfurovum sp. TaxID=269237 RepID=A0A6S6STT6_9BACT|nr:MAG: Putative nucleic acid-binding protein [uncultured Sulfurovum sp.]
MKNIFLDTNIILDFLDKKRPLHTESKALISKLITEDYSIFISEDMLSTIFYISKDKEKVLLFFETIIDKWSVVPYGVALISQAITNCKTHQGQDLEDTLQCLCAKKHDCVYIITSDKGFVDCGVEVLNYDEMLNN